MIGYTVKTQRKCCVLACIKVLHTQNNWIMEQAIADIEDKIREMELRGLLSNYTMYLTNVHPDINVRIADELGENYTLEVEREGTRENCTIEFIMPSGPYRRMLSQAYMTVLLQGVNLRLRPEFHGLSERKYETEHHTYTEAYLTKGKHGDPDSLEIRRVLLGELSYTRKLLKQMVGDALGLRYPTRSITNPEHPPRRDNGKYSERS
jgi:hypothetical protein